MSLFPFKLGPFEVPADFNSNATDLMHSATLAC